MGDPAVPPIAVTIGDPAGIGPEVAMRAATAAGREGIDVVLVGPAAAWIGQAERLGITDIARLDSMGGHLDGPHQSHHAAGPSAAGGHVALEAVERGIAGCLAGDFSALVTAPISKESIAMAGSPFHGHTELLAERSGAAGHAMMLVREGETPLRVALLTIHVPLRDVAAMITADRIAGTLAVVADALATDWGIVRPRLALLGLNPHAGDGGVLGSEEGEVIEPAIAGARMAGREVEGPFPADAFFGRQAWRVFDAVVACYHDQGLAPFKAIAQGSGVNVTCGLPFVRTSPDHGTAFDIAGRGVADPGSMLEAIRLAARLAARRRGDL